MLTINVRENSTPSTTVMRDYSLNSNAMEDADHLCKDNCILIICNRDSNVRGLN